MIKSKLRLASCLLSLTILSGCATSLPEGKYMPMQTFENLQPISLAVKGKTIKSVPENNMATDTFPFDLSEMTQIYLDRKMKPTGVQGTIVASIDEATITDVHQKADSKAIGWLGMGGFDLYEVDLKIRLEHRNDNGDLVYGNSVNAQRQVRISQHLSVADREKAQFEALEKLFTELDQRMNMVLLEKMRLGN